MTLRKAGAEPDTTVETVVYDGSSYLVVFDRDDRVIEIKLKMIKQGRFYGWRTQWAQGCGKPMSPRHQEIADLTTLEEIG